MNSKAVNKCVDENHEVGHSGDMAFALELSGSCVMETVVWAAAHVPPQAGATDENPTDAAPPPPPILTEDKRRIVAVQTAPLP